MSVPAAQKTHSFSINAVMLYTKSSIKCDGRIVALALENVINKLNVELISSLLSN